MGVTLVGHVGVGWYWVLYLVGLVTPGQFSAVLWWVLEMVLSQCMGFSCFGLQLGSVKTCFGSGHSVLGSFGAGDVVWLSQAGGPAGSVCPQWCILLGGGGGDW